MAIKGLGSAAYTESTAYASKSDLNSKITGNGTINNIIKVTELPATPDEHTMYVIIKTS